MLSSGTKAEQVAGGRPTDGADRNLSVGLCIRAFSVTAFLCAYDCKSHSSKDFRINLRATTCVRNVVFALPMLPTL